MAMNERSVFTVSNWRSHITASRTGDRRNGGESYVLPRSNRRDPQGSGLGDAAAAVGVGVKPLKVNVGKKVK
jgi:hypothetical protein